jgi:methionine biosynthesis protein MetW
MTVPRSFYDQYWTEAGFQPPSNVNKFLDRKVAELCVPGARVADLGCGDGRTIGDRAARRDVHYVGVDVSPSGVASATSRGLDVRLIDDISDTGLATDGFDAVFVIEVLEHLFDPLAAVTEARRILRPGGSLVVTVPNSAVWPRRMELLVQGRPNAMGDNLSRSEPWRDPHIRQFTLRSLRGLLHSADFAHIEVGGTEPVAPRPVGDRLTQLRPGLFARRCTATAVK